jgi:hypothetical protein
VVSSQISATMFRGAPMGRIGKECLPSFIYREMVILPQMVHAIQAPESARDQLPG